MFSSGKKVSHSWPCLVFFFLPFSSFEKRGKTGGGRKYEILKHAFPPPLLCPPFFLGKEIILAAKSCICSLKAAFFFAHILNYIVKKNISFYTVLPDRPVQKYPTMSPNSPPNLIATAATTALALVAFMPSPTSSNYDTR